MKLLQAGQTGQVQIRMGRRAYGLDRTARTVDGFGRDAMSSAGPAENLGR